MIRSKRSKSSSRTSAPQTDADRRRAAPRAAIERGSAIADVVVVRTRGIDFDSRTPGAARHQAAENALRRRRAAECCPCKQQNPHLRSPRNQSEMAILARRAAPPNRGSRCMDPRARHIFTACLVCADTAGHRGAGLRLVGPVTISNKRVTARLTCSDAGIAPPDPTLIAERLDVPDGFTPAGLFDRRSLARLHGPYTGRRPDRDADAARYSVSILQREIVNGDGRSDGHRVLLDGLQGPQAWRARTAGCTRRAHRDRSRALRCPETGTITGPTRTS